MATFAPDFVIASWKLLPHPRTLLTGQFGRSEGDILTLDLLLITHLPLLYRMLFSVKFLISSTVEASLKVRFGNYANQINT
jgi:hypothetical protein